MLKDQYEKFLEKHNEKSKQILQLESEIRELKRKASDLTPRTS
jgi:cell division septum initiation protein DivIVA